MADNKPPEQEKKMIYTNYTDFVTEVTDRVTNYEDLYQEAMGLDHDDLEGLASTVLEEIPQSTNLTDWEWDKVIKEAVADLEELQNEN